MPWECPERGTDGHGATPGDADGISPQGCECGRGNGAPGHPGRKDGGTHGQGAPGSRIIAPAATNEPRMDWAPILQGKGHGAHPGTPRGTRLYYRHHLQDCQATRQNCPGWGRRTRPGATSDPRTGQNRPGTAKTQVPKMSQKRRFVFTILYTFC